MRYAPFILAVAVLGMRAASARNTQRSVAGETPVLQSSVRGETPVLQSSVPGETPALRSSVPGRTPVLQSSVAGQTPALQPSGTFTDKTGKSHAWAIPASRSLLWDGETYAPIGGWFAPRYLAIGATEANWALDAADLATLKAGGVTDIIVTPSVSVCSVDPAAWQRMVDHLDEQGFRYGIAMGAGLDTSPTGVVVNPSAHRIPGVHEGMDVAWDVADADYAWFIVVDSRDGTQIAEEGRVLCRNGQAAVTTGARVADGSVAILYPHGPLRYGRRGTIPDVWAGLDRYRDRLLLSLGRVKFGSGLRFFLDPLGPPIALDGDAENFVPDSPAFRLEWEAFLSRKYQTMDALATAWSLMDRDIRDHRAASGLIPLWSRSKGVPFLLDMAIGKRYQIGGGESRFWTDLQECRDASLTYAMSAVADLMKREIANVPVVYSHTGLHRVFTAPSGPGGWDGLGAAVTGQGAVLRTASTEAAFSQVSDAAKPVWFLITEAGNPPGSRAPYASRDALFADLDRMRGLGARTVFMQGLAGVTEGDGGLVAMTLDAEHAGHLGEYSRRAAAATSAQVGPRALPYPAAAAGLVQSGPIGSGGVLWVPSLAPGRAMDFGASYAGYTIKLPEGETLVMWSHKGDRETRLSVADPRKVQAFSPDGLPVEIKADVKGRIARLVVMETPLLVRTGGQDVFPVEAVEDALRELRALVAEAQAQKLPAQDFRYRLDTAEARYRHRDMATAFVMCSQALAGIVDLMQPYSWREAEHANVQTFTEVMTDPGASAGMYLALNTSASPPRDGYSLQLQFRAPADDTYDVWLACTPPGQTTSAFAWIVDAGETRTSADGSVVGASYLGDRFCWMNLGRVPMKPGNHTFTLRVTDRSAIGAAYSLAVDALLVTRAPFTPRGTARPQAVPSR